MNTQENAQAALQILQQQRFQTVLVVTSEQHMRRARLLFSSVGLDCPPPAEQQALGTHNGGQASAKRFVRVENQTEQKQPTSLSSSNKREKKPTASPALGETALDQADLGATALDRTTKPIALPEHQAERKPTCSSYPVARREKAKLELALFLPSLEALQASYQTAKEYLAILSFKLFKGRSGKEQ